MRESPAEYRGKPNTHRHHGQHRRPRKAVLLERQRSEDEYQAVDGESRGRDRTKYRGCTRDDG